MNRTIASLLSLLPALALSSCIDGGLEPSGTSEFRVTHMVTRHLDDTATTDLVEGWFRRTDESHSLDAGTVTFNSRPMERLVSEGSHHYRLTSDSIGLFIPIDRSGLRIATTGGSVGATTIGGFAPSEEMTILFPRVGDTLRSSGFTLRWEPNDNAGAYINIVFSYDSFGGFAGIFNAKDNGRYTIDSSEIERMSLKEGPLRVAIVRGTRTDSYGPSNMQRRLFVSTGTEIEAIYKR